MGIFKIIKSNKKIILTVFSAAFIFFLCCVFLPEKFWAKDEYRFVIEKGAGSKEISVALEKNGLISWGPAFRFFALATGASKNLKAGTYYFSASMNIPEIVGKLKRGDIAKETITVVEGWDLRDIGMALEQEKLFEKNQFWFAAGYPDYNSKPDPQMQTVEDFSDYYDFLSDKPKTAGLEGYIFPDTYEVANVDGVNTFIKDTLDNFGKKLTPGMRAEIKKQKKTVFDIVTMASLIEKEVRTLNDKKIVSGLLWKRMSVYMPLQVDATIAYIKGSATTEVSIADTKTDSPYNTYKYLGLPQGPICSPGLDSIIAAIYPKSSPYWYYLSTPEGKTIFSRTLDEHNIAKIKYLK
jgi:UPF0755 protein